MADNVIPLEPPRAWDAGALVVGPNDLIEISRADRRRAAMARPIRRVMSRLSARINRLDGRLRDVDRGLARIREQIEKGGAGSFTPPLPTMVYLSLIGLVLVLEVSLNKGALDRLRIAEVHAWMTAGFVSAVNLIAAKTTALLLAERPSIRRWEAWAVCLVTNASLAASLWFLSALRAEDVGAAGGGSIFLALQLAGYLSVLLLSYQQNASSALLRCEARMVSELNDAWRDRALLAERHDVALEDGRRAIAEEIETALERIYQFREGNLLGRADPPPAYFRSAVPRSAFVGIDLGSPADPPPASLENVVRSYGRDGR